MLRFVFIQPTLANWQMHVYIPSHLFSSFLFFALFGILVSISFIDMLRSGTLKVCVHLLSLSLQLVLHCCCCIVLFISSSLLCQALCVFCLFLYTYSNEKKLIDGLFLISPPSLFSPYIHFYLILVSDSP